MTAQEHSCKLPDITAWGKWGGIRDTFHCHCGARWNVYTLLDERNNQTRNKEWRQTA